MPAAAEYAEIEDPAFPEESSTISSIPKDLKHEIKIDVPRSLKEPVGFCASFFVSRFIPNQLLRLIKLIVGVFPSPNENLSDVVFNGRGILKIPVSVVEVLG